MQIFFSHGDTEITASAKVLFFSRKARKGARAQRDKLNFVADFTR
jgi:hypothetical protein